MRIIEILLPKNVSDRSLSKQYIQRIDVLQKRMDKYVDAIMDPKTTTNGREFLKSKLKDDLYDLKGLLKPLHKIDTLAEAIHTLPLSDDDFDLVKKMMEKPIPSAVSQIYLRDIIDEDELNNQLEILAATDPGRDVRPLIVAWIKQWMPDQMYKFTNDVADEKQRQGVLSPIHGYGLSSNNKSTDTGNQSSGNAYGFR